MSGNNQWRPLDWFLAALLGLGAFASYALTLAPTVLAGDGGEFQFVPYLLGVAHPTGYPLYTFLGWAWSHLLPVGDVAYRMNLFSAFWAALAAGLLYPTIRTLLRQVLPGLSPAIQRLISALTAATFGLTPTLWSQAIIAEVYGLQTFLVAALLYLLLTWAEHRDPRLLLLAALCFGLGLAHHSTTVLLAPAILVYLSLVDRGIFRDWRLILSAVLLAVLPLALYLLIPLRAPHTPYLSLPLTTDRALVLYDNSLASFVHFVLGGPFGGSVDLSVNLPERLAMALGFLRNEISLFGIILALGGLGCFVYTHLPDLGPLAGSRLGLPDHAAALEASDCCPSGGPLFCLSALDGSISLSGRGPESEHPCPHPVGGDPGRASARRRRTGQQRSQQHHAPLVFPIRRRDPPRYTWPLSPHHARIPHLGSRPRFGLEHRTAGVPHQRDARR
jgi:type IV secretory pathway TrbD component